jgi:hypothetical protein
MARLILAFLSIILVVPLFAFGQSQKNIVVCPEPPTVTESIVNGDAHWEAIRDEGKRGLHLESVSIYAGHPSRLGSLIPDQVVSKGRTRNSIWKLPATPNEEYWLACGYMNTQLMLAQRIPLGTKRCEVNESLLPNGNRLTINSISCE